MNLCMCAHDLENGSLSALFDCMFNIWESVEYLKLHLCVRHNMNSVLRFNARCMVE